MPPNPLRSGELTFTVVEKHDRNGDLYLFGGIPFFNCVIFLRPSGQNGPDGRPKWDASVRPYTGPQQEDSPEEDVWRDSPDKPKPRSGR